MSYKVSPVLFVRFSYLNKKKSDLNQLKITTIRTQAVLSLQDLSLFRKLKKLSYLEEEGEGEIGIYYACTRSLIYKIYLNANRYIGIYILKGLQQGGTKTLHEI